jgi:hypothetical protein
MRQGADLIPLFLAAVLGVALAAQDSLDTTLTDLQSRDRAVRLRAVRLLKASPSPEAAVPVAPLVTDPEDVIQFEAIWTELNIFLAERVVPERRVGFVVRVREKIEAEPIFSAGPLALSGEPVPAPVSSALLRAATDDNPRVGVEALYAFGALAGDTRGATRRELQRTAAPRLVALVGATDPTLRFGVARVVGRLFGRLGDEPPADERVGDAMVALLNDRERPIAQAAMQALGALRYERAVQALTDLVAYYGRRDPAVTALEALARIAHPSSAALFRRELEDRDDTRRQMAVEGLARARDRASLAAIESSLLVARSAALQLAGRFAAVTLGGAPLQPITDALANPGLREQALAYLLEIAAERPIALADAARHPDAAVRMALADVLGICRNPDARPIVDALVEDADAGVASSAARAAARLRDGA